MSLDINTRPLTVEQRIANLERQNAELAAAYAQAIANSNAAAAAAAQQAMDKARREMLNELSRLQKELSEKTSAQADVNRKQLQSLRVTLARTSESIAQQMKDLSRTLDKKMDKGFEEVGKSIRKMDNALSKRIDTIGNDLSSVRKDVDGILSKMEKEHKQAKELVGEASSLLRIVERRSPVARYTPEELSRITSELSTVASMEIPDSSVIALVEKLILDTLRMENEAVALSLKHQALLALVGGLITSLEDFLKDNAKVEVTSKGRTGSVEADKWTLGQSAKIAERLSQLSAIISSDTNTDGAPLTDEQVLAIQDEVSALGNEATASLEGAIAKVLDAWDRIDILSQIAACQSDMGKVVKTENGRKAMGSLGGDIMDGSFVIMEDTLTGESTTFIVVPGEDGSPRLVMQNNMEGATDSQIALNTERIRSSLEQKGIGMPSGNGKCLGHKPLPELGSASSLSGKSGAEVLRSRLSQQGK
ncbi:MAG: hypothetical protein IJ202_14635 [Bacteroidales bacterium]|nr:hypothetical protein [Bacteroidales bacterium]